MLQIEIVPILSDNYSYLLRDEASGEVAVVAPGEAGPLLQRLDERGWHLTWVLVTHHHGDHVDGVGEMRARTAAKLAAPAADAGRLADIDQPLSDGDRFALGDSSADVIATPGHTLDHISLYFPNSRALFCADTLFVLGCGRVFEGSFAQMHESLQKLAALPEETRVYCGHEYTLANAHFAQTVDPDNKDLEERIGEIVQVLNSGHYTVPSTIALEKATNPFLRPHDAGIRSALGMADASDPDVFAEIRRRKDAA